MCVEVECEEAVGSPGWRRKEEIVDADDDVRITVCECLVAAANQPVPCIARGMM